MNNIMRGLVEQLGYLINPLFLNPVRENNKLLVFFFHGLFESDKDRDLNHIDPQQNMTTGQFCEFIEYFLYHNYTFIKPDDLLGIDDNQSDRRYVILTFDDGYFSNMLAVDFLNKYKVPAVFYITIKNILQNSSFWWDIIFKYRIKQGLSVNKIRKEQDSLKLLGHNNIDEYIKNNFGADSFKPWSDIDRPFSESEVRSLSTNPFVSFGNHTFNHSILTTCTRDEIRNEFIESNKYIIDFAGKAPISLAFPNGYFNELVLEVAKEIGFEFACTAEPKINRLPLDKKKPVCLTRFMSNPRDIQNYGSFYRLGYSPGRLYSGFKQIINPFKKNEESY